MTLNNENHPGDESTTGAQGARERVRHAAEDLKTRAGAAASEAGRAASGATERLRESAKSAGAQVKQAAMDTGEDLKTRGKQYVGTQKTRAAEEVSHLGAAVRGAADRLHESDDDHIAHYAEALADRIDRASGYLRDRDTGQMWRDTQAFARRRPEVVAAGMFAAGLVVARLLKASDQPPTHDRRDPGQDPYNQHDLDREAALDTDAETVGSHLPATPTGPTRAFESGGFSTVSSANPTGATPAPPPGAAPSASYPPGRTDASKPITP